MNQDAVVDYLIVGQGLAGTLLGRAFERRGISFRIVEQEKPVSSSRVAAGLVHPVTGRRRAKSWMADTFLTFNESYYNSLHRDTGELFYHAVDGLEVAATVKECNDWTARMSDPDLDHLLVGQYTGDDYKTALQPSAGQFVMRHCGWMDLPRFLDFFRVNWSNQGILLTDTFDPTSLQLTEEFVQFNQVSARSIIFCEGEQARKNPLWSWLPFDPVKGEILTIRVPGLPQQHIIFHGLFLVPIGNERFRAGATYSWHELDQIPTEQAKKDLIDKLESVLRLPFELIDHQAGIRPAVKGRRPLIGRHPKHANVFLLNGLGSKGVLMGPWLTENFADWLSGKGTLHPETDIARYYIFVGDQ